MICNDNYVTINLIQGDTLSVDFIIDDLVYTEDARVFFVCKQLDIKEELPMYVAGEEDSDDWEWSKSIIRVLNIPDTTGFRIGEFEYDLMAYEDEFNRTTYIYHGTLSVMPRYGRRRQGYNPYYEYPKNTRHTPAHQSKSGIPIPDNVVGGIGYNTPDNNNNTPGGHGFGYTED